MSEEKKDWIGNIIYTKLREILIPQRKPDELIKIESLINEGDYNAAFSLLKDIETENSLDQPSALTLHLIMASLMNKIGDYPEGLNYSQMGYNEAKTSKKKKKIELIDFCLNMALSLMWLGSLDKILEVLTECEELLELSKRQSIEDKERKKAAIYYIYAGTYYFLGDPKQGMGYAKQCLDIREKYGNKSEIAEALFWITAHYTLLKDDFETALSYAERAQKLAEESNNHQIIAFNLMNLGLLYSLEGEYDKSLEYNLKCLPMIEATGNHTLISAIHMNISGLKFWQGKHDEGYEHFKTALELSYQIQNNFILATLISNFVKYFIDIGDLDSAQEYLGELRLINEQKDNVLIQHSYLDEKAYDLKLKPDLESQIDTELIKQIINEDLINEALRQIINEDTVKNDILIVTLTLLCDLLLKKLKITNNDEILDEINPLLKRLLKICQDSNSYWILSETYTLQAKLALLILDIKEARRLLTLAQRIAEEHGMYILAEKISIEHDNILKEINKLESLKEEEIPISKRMDIIHVEDQIKVMLRKGDLSKIESFDEDPVVLLVLAEGGMPLFSHIFSERWSFEDDLFGGFLSAINSFSGEIFSEGLDRAKFGEHTVILKPMDNFLVCYLYKGHSYRAIKRIKFFIDHIQNTEEIWNAFNMSRNTNRVIEINKIPQLKSVIKQMFS